MIDENKRIPKRIAQTVLNSLKGGVVPRIGLPYITVGRKNEIEALLHDVEIISEGGASFQAMDRIPNTSGASRGRWNTRPPARQRRPPCALSSAATGPGKVF